MIGFHVHPRVNGVSVESAHRFNALPVANVSDVMSRMAASPACLRPMHDGARMAGPALTVKTRPGDNLMVHKALAMAQPGDVVVVDAGGDLSNAIIGEIMAGRAAKRGLGGIVIYGAIRDSDEIRRGSLPVYAAGITHRGPYKDGPGEINIPVSLGGMVITPGDLIIGDADGLMCIPQAQVEEVYAAACAKHQDEVQMLANIAAGKLDTAWIDQQLKALGCGGV